MAQVQWHPIKCEPKAELRHGHWYVLNGGADDILQIESRFKVKITNPDKTKVWTKVGISWIFNEDGRTRSPDISVMRLITPNYDGDVVSIEELNTYLWSSKEYEKYINTKNTIEVGDFVKCSGQRDTKSWRKITEISEFDIVGQKYRYEDGKGFISEPHMSSNGIKTITHILKKDMANDYCA